MRPALACSWARCWASDLQIAGRGQRPQAGGGPVGVGHRREIGGRLTGESAGHGERPADQGEHGHGKQGDSFEQADSLDRSDLAHSSYRLPGPATLSG
jgi:hypothetical protein